MSVLMYTDGSSVTNFLSGGAQLPLNGVLVQKRYTVDDIMTTGFCATAPARETSSESGSWSVSDREGERARHSGVSDRERQRGSAPTEAGGERKRKVYAFQRSYREPPKAAARS